MSNYADSNMVAPAWVGETPHIYNVTMTNKNTEYSQLLPAGCKRFTFSVQSGVSTYTYRVAFVTGKVATPTAPYISRDCNLDYPEEQINLSATTLYFACSADSKVAQIIAWT